MFKILIRSTLLFLVIITSSALSQYQYSNGAIIRGDISKKELALVFTGDQYADGALLICDALIKCDIKASFFFTGNFYRNPQFKKIILTLKNDGHYLGAHSDQHLLYCSWEKRDSLLITKDDFIKDLARNYQEMKKFGITKNDARYFLPPYEWYNDTISTWTREYDLILINFTPGTKSHTDWTYPQLGKAYVNSDTIFESIISYELKKSDGLNGFILLCHIGSDERRLDKFHFQLEQLIRILLEKGYSFVRIDKLLTTID